MDGLTGPGAVASPAGAPTALGAAAAALLGHDPTAWLDQRGPTPAAGALTEVLGLLVEHLDTHHARPGFTAELLAPLLDDGARH